MDINQLFNKYLNDISLKYSHIETSEMGYRTDFETLLKSIFVGLHIHHDAKTLKGNKPDFIIYKDIPLLYIEVKDIGVSLDKIEKSDQMARYYGYANLILTDYIEFRFYRNGIKYQEPIKIAEYDKLKRTLKFDQNQFAFLSKTMVDFARSHKEPIKSGLHLAKILGGRASRIRDNVKEMLSKQEDNSDLQKIFEVVKTSLLSDLNIEKFADMYAQTLVYGLFVARYYDKTHEDFSRQEARELLPATNPFLRAFFDHIAGSSFPDRLKFIVDELCEIFTHSNISDLLHDSYGYEKENRDPIIHFYEDFLREYDSQMKMELGVFYTPKEVVQFIIRSVDEILKTEFGLIKGLTDTSKIKKKVYETNNNGKSVKVDKEFHKVQILDIATGTGSFLNEAILHIYKSFENNKGSWEVYVKEHLIPRLHGFELMMASYTIAHLKLGITLGETGVRDLNKRLGVYLTNTLEEGVSTSDLIPMFGFMESISNEARQASIVKNELPIMVVIGNPPYNVNSTNKGKYILKLISDYKKGLKEKNIQPLSDDYIKFIRFSESLIETNRIGIMAMITNNSFLDGIIHRQMRRHLLETFDKIYILDLHGNSKKKQIPPNGLRDENIFQIQQGVCIFLMVRSSETKINLSKVYHSELWGKQNEKLERLKKFDIKQFEWKELMIDEEYSFFVPKKFDKTGNYETGFKIDEIFTIYNSGIQTKRDSLFIDIDQTRLEERIKILLSNNISNQFINLYKVNNSLSFNLKQRIELKLFDPEKIIKISYRPFDQQFIYYDPTIVSRPGYQAAEPMITGSNLSLITTRINPNNNFSTILLTNLVSDIHSVSDQSYVFPLYIYKKGSKSLNLGVSICDKIYEIVGEVAPEDILDYIYAVLYTPSYREKYKEFLKIDFPRVPYPSDKRTFQELADLGSRLRELHLMESPDLEALEKTSFNISGSNLVEKPKFENNKVYINEEQYFDNVSEIAWNFYIGGYQPAQKWLKDRKGRTLSYEDVEHYRKIIAIFDETDKIMKELDKINNIS